MYFGKSSRTVSGTGSGSLKLTPPTSSTYKGITVFASRNPSTMPVFSLSGSKDYALHGTIYCAGLLNGTEAVMAGQTTRPTSHECTSHGNEGSLVA